MKTKLVILMAILIGCGGGGLITATGTGGGSPTDAGALDTVNDQGGVDPQPTCPAPMLDQDAALDCGRD